jgi:hypothetical protein
LNEITAEEKLSGVASTGSGLLSFLGGYNVCHNICLGLIAGLTLIGISIEGMPLAFLQDYAVPMWVLAVTMLGITLYLYKKHQCVSKNLLAANTGLIIAATPFRELEFLQIAFWIVGFGLVGVAIINYVSTKLEKKEEKKCCHIQTQ